MCIKVRLYVQFESTLPTLDKSFDLQRYWRLRKRLMCEIAPLSPITSIRTYIILHNFDFFSSTSIYILYFIVIFFYNYTIFGMFYRFFRSYLLLLILIVLNICVKSNTLK